MGESLMRFNRLILLFLFWHLSFVFSASAQQSIIQKHTPSQTEINYLFEQLFYWQGQNNEYQQQVILEKISKVNNEHPVYLEAMLLNAVKEKQFVEAKQYLIKLGQIITDKTQIQAYSTLISIFETQRNVLSQARILAKRKKYSQALEKYQSILPENGIHPMLALEYWDVLSVVHPEQEGQILKQLLALVKRYPTNNKLQLAYLKYLVHSKTYSAEVYDKLEKLTLDPIWLPEARRIWQSALERKPVTANNQALFRRYLKRFPEDNFLQIHFQKGLTALAYHQKMLSVPQYKAKLAGLKLLEQNGDNNKIKQKLSYALRYFKNDIELITGLGKVNLRQALYEDAKSYFKRCLQLERFNSQCRSLLKTANYWQNIAQAKQQINNQQFEQAHNLLKTLHNMNSEGVAHWVLEGDYYLYKQQYTLAEQNYNKALKFDPLNRSALRSLLTLKEQQSDIEQLEHWLAKLSTKQSQQIEKNIVAAKIKLLRDKADHLLAKGNITQAIETLGKALALNPEHIWARYDLARIYANQHDAEKVEFLYQQINNDESAYAYALILSSLEKYDQAIKQLEQTNVATRTPAMKASLQRFYVEALQQRVENTTETNEQQALIEQFNLQRITEPALKYSIAKLAAKHGLYTMAQNLLSTLAKQDKANEIKYQLLAINTYQQQGKLLNAEKLLTRLIIKPKLTPEQQEEIAKLVVNQLRKDINSTVNIDWLLNYSEQQIAQNAKAENAYNIKQQYAQLTQNKRLEFATLQQKAAAFPEQQKHQQALLNYYNDQPNLLDKTQANYFYQTIVLAHIKKFPFDLTGYQTAAKYQQQYGQVHSAQHFLNKALQVAVLNEQLTALGISPDTIKEQADLVAKLANIKQNNKQLKTKVEQLEQLLNANNEEAYLAISEQSNQWQVKSLRKQIYQYNEHENTVFEIGFQGYSKSGTPGQSEYALDVLPMSLTMPLDNDWLGSGRWYVRFEPTKINAGTLSSTDQSYEEFGALKLCDTPCNFADQPQNQTGYAVALGVELDHWRADIGTTPIGFKQYDWVGGFEFDGDIGKASWSALIAKRPVTNSVLAYASSEDPFSKLTWGAAKIYTLGGSLNYDQGTGWGIWSVFDYSLILGKQIKDNNRIRAMAGIYYTWFDSEKLTSSIGLNSLNWQYKYDLSEFTLGQAGYYSPQQYSSLSIPFDFYGRINDFSYKVYLGISVSKSSDNTIDYYPEHSLYQQALLAKNNQNIAESQFSGGSGSGFGYNIAADVEYKINQHWSIGAAMDIQQYEYFSPNTLSLYLRYYFDRSVLPVYKPPKPIKPYLDF
jgi:tetratricopeptide (TPR) repeat protein